MYSSQVLYPFATAPYSYFTITNLKESRSDFLKDGCASPVFEYQKWFSLPKIQSRIAKITDANTLERMKLVETAAKLQKDESFLAEFKQKNVELYGLPRKDYFDRILYFILHKYAAEDLRELARDNADFGELVDYAMRLPASELVDKKTYRQMQKHFQKYFEGMKECTSLPEAMTRIFVKSKLADQGWKLIAEDNDSHARISLRSKQIAYGIDYVPRGRESYVYNSIALHEIYGHAVRAKEDTVLDVAKSEGWAVLLEQLNAPHFSTRRSFRFLAAALATGIYNGKELNFNETYELIWRLMSLSGRYTQKQAKEHAFDEVARVFRGGRPDLPGAVFLKDIAYLTGNLAIWGTFEKQCPSYAQFVDIIEGRKEIEL